MRFVTINGTETRAEFAECIAHLRTMQVRARVKDELQDDIDELLDALDTTTA